MARTAGAHPRLVKYISIIHPLVSGRAQVGGGMRISVRRIADIRGDVSPPGFGCAPALPLRDFFVKPDAE